MTNASTEVLSLAMRLAREAGEIQRDRYEGQHEIETKSAAIDLVTEVDKQCEALIVRSIRSERPGDAIVAEEGGDHRNDAADWRWIIDPLDGTVNYAHGFPRFCVSIGVECEGVRQVGVVYDPLLDECFHAVRGSGAFLGDRRLSVSATPKLSEALIATGFAYDVHRSEADNLRHFGHMLKMSISNQILFCLMWLGIGLAGLVIEVVSTARAAKRQEMSPTVRSARVAAFSMTPSVVASMRRSP